nr:MAG TPA: hypothetical protein [Caudoviricetes sp.]
MTVCSLRWHFQFKVYKTSTYGLECYLSFQLFHFPLSYCI